MRITAKHKGADKVKGTAILGQPGLDTLITLNRSLILFL